MDTIAEAIAGPFQYEFMVRALIVSALVGIMCPLLGVYVVSRGLGFMGDALAHSVLPGMVAAFMLGISPFAGTVPMAIVVALVTGYLIKRTGLGEDTSMGIIFAGLFALGLTMLTAARGLPVNLEDILLGQVLGVSQTDVYVTLGLAGAALALTYLLYKEMVFASFDPIGASVVGLPAEKLEYALLGMLAVVTVMSLQAVGIVLVLSMLITPAAAALLMVRNFPRAMALGALIGVTSAVAGLYVSFHVNLPSGPVMALVATGIFILCLFGKTWVAPLLRRSPARSPAAGTGPTMPVSPHGADGADR